MYPVGFLKFDAYDVCHFDERSEEKSFYMPEIKLFATLARAP